MNRFAVFIALVIGGGSMWLHAQPINPFRLSIHDRVFALCGREGGACCHAPANVHAPPEVGPLVSCGAGLGCDITTDTCVSACGNPGQACCDGLDTRATRWTDDGRLFVPNAFNTRDMCQGSSCDPPSRKCIGGCGMSAGEACCGIQPGVGVATCINPALYCEFNAGSWTSGTCRQCGLLGKPACRSEPACQDGATEDVNNLCVPCGAIGQPVCDGAQPCRNGSVPEPPLHMTCVAPPPCGHEGEPPCADGTCSSGPPDLHPNLRGSTLVCTMNCGHTQGYCPCVFGMSGCPAAAGQTSTLVAPQPPCRTKQAGLSVYSCFDHSMIQNSNDCLCVPNLQNTCTTNTSVPSPPRPLSGLCVSASFTGC